MNGKYSSLIKPLAYFIALSVPATVGANGIDKSTDDIWYSHPEELKQAVENSELSPMEDYSNRTDQPSGKGMTVDVELLAKESGMSYAEAERAIKAQDTFARYGDRVIVRYADRIARIWQEPAPGTQSFIQFVGKIPAGVAQDMRQKRVPANVSVTGGATISLKNQIKRAEAAAKGLRKLGYINSSSFYDVINDVIQLDIKIPEHARNPDPQQVLHAIQNELRGTELSDQIRSLSRKNIKIKTIRGEGPIMEFDHARGGNWVRLSSGTRWCTSGWSVSGPNGDGIITAAHCNGLTQFEEEGGLVFNMNWRDQEFSLLGDVEYHTTNHLELDDFYAREGEIRDVNSIRSTWTMWGATVCEYGRSNNVRTCNHTVQATNVIVNYSIGTVGNLVRVSGDDSIGGDSGGGWSFNYTAWGVHSGSNGVQSFFTPVQQAEAVLNVTIKR
ncbi:MAG: S1 family peptidase [Gammaproteobacteria bacterium]|nr:S1 family peptidase [Gammaproteobacteria bacterium]